MEVVEKNRARAVDIGVLIEAHIGANFEEEKKVEETGLMAKNRR